MDQRLQKVTHFSQIATLMWLKYVTPEEVMMNARLRWIALDEYLHVYHSSEIPANVKGGWSLGCDFMKVMDLLPNKSIDKMTEFGEFESWLGCVAGGELENGCVLYRGAEVILRKGVFEEADYADYIARSAKQAFD
jgi:hypothetical protein